MTRSASPSERMELGAIVANRLAFGTEPTEPLREKGGVFDPNGWCMKYAEAILTAGVGKELPRIASDVEPPDAWAEQVAVAMDLDIYELV